ncbi:hypothetical protein Halha_1672 [Halobacteroides halobius DSM 5150]|uniref:Uncharacterized protein n=1 Tax=Halobacteroides halobius (strain ATCC 35273 / DSM 5150 / MD-1) TaxID=748449 RepID=L0KB49_HALHC|nr:hypothetical protein [Halobacteroides halobius]AGB41609.1 hypothetical protein Halha_1672 [Halobacteroides halobius DSM 5150]
MANKNDIDLSQLQSQINDILDQSLGQVKGLDATEIKEYVNDMMNQSFKQSKELTNAIDKADIKEHIRDMFNRSLDHLSNDSNNAPAKLGDKPKLLNDLGVKEPKPKYLELNNSIIMIMELPESVNGDNIGVAF